MKKNIQLYLVSGFLGSGKTTFLRHVLQQTELSRVGVIVNEFGSVGMDGKLLQSGKLTVEEINDGSIFCACLKAGFVRTLTDFLALPIDLLFVEASGIADPSGMESLLGQMDVIASRKGLERRYDYCGSVCIADAKFFLRFCDMFEATKSQIQKSSFLVVNKTDTVTEQELHELHEALHKLNPDAAICDTTFGQIPLSAIRQLVHPEGSVGESLNRPDNRPVTCALEATASCTTEEMKTFCRLLGSKVIRAKGFFRTPDGGIGRMDNAGEYIFVEQVNDPPKLRERDFCLIFFARPDCALEQELAAAWRKTFGREPVFR